MVINKICGETPTLGRVFLKKPPFSAHPITVCISIIKAFRCTVVYTMNPETGLFLASKLMGMPLTVLDEMGQSCLAELANMISGNVATVFSEKNILVDITPPAYHENTYPNFPSGVVCIPLSLANGMVFEVDVWLA